MRARDFTDHIDDLREAQASHHKPEPPPRQATQVDPVLSTVDPRTTVKTTVIGRPESIKRKGECTVVYFTSIPRPDQAGRFSLPRGIPNPNAQLWTRIKCYIGHKQFNKVSERLLDPDERLIVEGAITQVIEGMLTVYVSSVTTTGIQAELKAQQKAAAKVGDHEPA